MDKYLPQIFAVDLGSKQVTLLVSDRQFIPNLTLVIFVECKVKNTREMSRIGNDLQKPFYPFLF